MWDYWLGSATIFLLHFDLFKKPSFLDLNRHFSKEDMQVANKYMKRQMLNIVICSVQFSSVAQSCLTLCNPMKSSSQAPLSMEFSRQEYWRKLPLPSPGDFPNPGIEPRSPALQADSLLPEPPGKPFRWA